MEKPNYSEIVSLIQYFEEYQKEIPNGSIKEFGIWLFYKYQGDNNLTDDAIIDHSLQNNLRFYEGKDAEQQIGILIGRLNRYVKNYTKKTFGDYLSLEEFGFLAGVGHLHIPTKTELINFALFETTTGTEIIKRLIKAEYLEEFDNLDDKRSKRLKITDKGISVLNFSYQKMYKMSKLLTKPLNTEDKKNLLSILARLNLFHENHYLNHKEATIDELLKLYSLDTE